ncbi:hypothetical protein E3J62_09945 [candidate division TA06 bacterium]|uniref:Uncharacterized protein n=1 Tax=candidate division TA06 bacterium TaxID=2250710 RepID=A0A523UQ24_UNCT6|nr:MAG: hypothetical protein E3J62_09945 [candidate division TA06 bacterium]
MNASSIGVRSGWEVSNVEIYASNFSGAYAHVNGQSTERVSMLDIVRAIITVGAQGPLDLVRHGWRTLLPRLGRALISMACLQSNRGNWGLAESFHCLEQSEKATTSYWLGVSFTKLTAERKLGVSWLAYVDHLHSCGVVITSPGTRKRGDFLGRDQRGAWHVLESKGRSHNVETRLRRDAKFQATRVDSVNGVCPETRSACIVRLFDVPLKIELIDPPSNDDFSTVSWKIDEPGYFQDYYRPFIDHLSGSHTQTEVFAELAFEVADAELYGQSVRVGLPKEIYEHPSRAPEVTAMLIRNLEQESDAKVSIGADGILFAGVLPQSREVG